MKFSFRMSDYDEMENILRRMILLELEINEFRIRLVNENDNIRDLLLEFEALENAYRELRSNFENLWNNLNYASRNLGFINFSGFII